jgi:hypothetical protein
MRDAGLFYSIGIITRTSHYESITMTGTGFKASWLIGVRITVVWLFSVSVACAV